MDLAVRKLDMQDLALMFRNENLTYLNQYK